MNAGASHRLPPPGTFLKRSFKGKPVLVKVLAAGFEYDGQLKRPSTGEYRENRRKCLDAARIEVGQARLLRPPENLKAAGNALFAAIPGSEAVNLAFACSYKRIFGWETGIRTTIRSSRGWIIPLDDLPAGGGPF